MSAPYLVLVESNTSGTGELFSSAAMALWAKPVLVSCDPARYSYVARNGIETVQEDTSDFGRLQRRLAQLAETAGIAGIYSSSEYFIEMAARLAQAFSLPGAPPGVIAACRNKHVQRQHLNEAGVLVPRFKAIHSMEEARQGLREVALPLIVKPSYGTGSVGVRLCSSEREVLKHAAALFDRTTNERGLAMPAVVLFEEYLSGPEFSVETFGTTAIGVTKKHLSAVPFFVETGHDFPAALSRPETRAVELAALRALASVGLFWGPAHVELRMTPAGPAIIEINPRLAGGYIPEVVRQSTGIDLIRQTLCAVMGLPTELRPARHHCASVRFLIAPAEGILSSFNGLEVAAAVPGVTDVRTYAVPGARLAIFNDFRDRLGHVIAISQEGVAAARTAEYAHRAIQVGVTV